jgi:hypothetical protein
MISGLGTTKIYRIGAALLTVGSLASGCGYAMRTSRDPSRISRLGVSRIYVDPIQNETFRPGVENGVYSQLIRMLSATPGIRTVNSPEESHARLGGIVISAQRSVSGEIRASQLNPRNRGSDQLLVATEYAATLECSFALKQGEKVLWSGRFSRSRPFPANSQIGALGSTGALINESEFERALVEVATEMMTDVRNSLMQDFL